MPASATSHKRNRPFDGANHPARDDHVPTQQGRESSRDREDEIDALLSDPGAHPFQDADPDPCRPDDVISSVLYLSSAKSGPGPQPLGLVRAAGVGVGPAASAEEENEIRSDVFGLMAGGSRLEDERLTALEREIAKLPPEERSSLDKAVRLYPLLTVASPHVKMLLRENNFDAAEAAGRLARYWSGRERMFGSGAFSPGAFAEPTIADYRKHYWRCLRAADDTELDGEMRDLARVYVRCVHRVKIESMDEIIESCTVEKDRAAVMEARRVCPGAASTDGHKLIFLRCEEFVDEDAAVRMMKYWTAKSRLFGAEKLGKDITLEDVDSSIFDCHVEGHFILTPGADGSGRSILWILPDQVGTDGWTAEGLARYLWYVMHMALARENCRANGLTVIINYNSVTEEDLDKISAVRRLCRTIIVECMPVRIRVGHILLKPSSWWKHLLLRALGKCGAWMDKRVVVHVGTPKEVGSVLKDRFGIGPDQMLRENGGKIDLDWWSGWILQRREQGL